MHLAVVGRCRPPAWRRARGHRDEAPEDRARVLPLEGDADALRNPKRLGLRPCVLGSRRAPSHPIHEASHRPVPSATMRFKHTWREAEADLCTQVCGTEVCPLQLFVPDEHLTWLSGDLADEARLKPAGTSEVQRLGVTLHASWKPDVGRAARGRGGRQSVITGAAGEQAGFLALRTGTGVWSELRLH